MSQYLPVIVLTALATIFGALSFGASRLLAPRRPSSAKEAPYECGIVPSREPPERFPVSFYIVAMLFIMFDIEIIFLYPYAVTRAELGVYGLVAIVIFSAVFFLTFVYEIARGGLDWGPMQRTERVNDTMSTISTVGAVSPVGSVRTTGELEPVRAISMVSPERTARTTIRRVGTEGRPEEAA